MKRIFYTSGTLILLFSVLAIGSCKKTQDPNGLVKSVTDSNTQNGNTTSSTTTYTYDSQNRLVLEQPGAGTPVTVTYGSGQVTESQGSNNVIYNLNSSGLAISDNGGYSYSYDNDGYNILVTLGNNSLASTISGGDVASQRLTVNGNTTNYSYTYLDKKDYRSTGQAYLGKNSVHLINIKTASAGTTTVTYTYSYTFDSKGRVQTETYITGTETDVKTYTYTD